MSIFNRKLEKKVNELEERIWHLENPPEFKINDIVDHDPHVWFGLHPLEKKEKCRVLMNKFDGYSTKYLLDGKDGVFWAYQCNLTLSKKK